MPHEPGHVAATGDVNLFLGDAGGGRTVKEIEPGRFLIIEADGTTRIFDAGITQDPSVSPGQQAQLEQGEEQFQQREARLTDQFFAGIATDAETLEQRIREFNATYGVDLAQLELTRDGQIAAEARGNRSDALRLAGMVANQQNAINQNLLTVTQMRQSAANLQLQLNESARGREADQAFAAAQNAANRAIDLIQITENAKAKNIDQQIAIAGMVADFARDPGDILANVAAIEQFGSISTALAEGFTGLTEEGLQPLEQLLTTQDTARAEGARLGEQREGLQGALDRALDPTFGVQPFQPAQVPQVEVPELQQPDLSGLFDSFLEALGGAMAAPTAGAVEGGQPEASRTPPGGVIDPSLQRLIDDPSLATEGQLEQIRALGLSAEHGGVFNNAALVGDSTDGKENPELAMVTPGGELLVVPVDKEDVPAGTPKMQEGGLVDTTRSRSLIESFLMPALARFISAAPNIPLAGGVPTPVGVSAPGTNPDIQEAAAGLAAGRGVRRSTFGRERREAAPTGIRQGIFRRSA